MAQQPKLYPNLFNAHALSVARNDSHARYGNHLRINHNPEYGLPVAPFIVRKAETTFFRLERENAFKTAVTFKDADGRVLTPPFTTKRGDVVTVTFNTVDNASVLTPIWAEVIAEPLKPINTPTRPLTDPRNPGFRPIGEGFLEDFRRGSGLEGRFDLRRITSPNLSVAAFLPSVGENIYEFGTRSEAPYAFSGPGLLKLEIRGAARVEGVRWLAAEDIPDNLKWSYVDIVNMPHPGGRRYLSVSNWQALCDKRVREQTPKRRPLQDVPSAMAPGSAPAHNVAQEQDRVASLFSPVAGDLDHLIRDAQDPWSQISSNAVNAVNTPTNPDTSQPDVQNKADIPRMFNVLMSQFDPGAASYFGFKTFDEAPSSSDMHLTFYDVFGFFEDPDISADNVGKSLFNLFNSRNKNAPEGTASTLSAGQFRELMQGLVENEGNDMKLQGDFDMEMRIRSLRFPAVADRRAPLDVLDPPKLGEPRTKDWVPVPLPDARREVEIDILKAVPNALFAYGKRQNAQGGTWENLNRINGQNWRLPTILGMNFFDGLRPDHPDEMVGSLNSKHFAPEDFRFYAAQQDRFGRFSPFASVYGVAKLRPGPPRPTVSATYIAPKISTGSHQGTINYQIPVPDITALAPGGYHLRELKVTVHYRGADHDFFHPESSKIDRKANDPAYDPTDPDYTPDFYIYGTTLGPPLAALSEEPVRITAIWIDQNNTASPLSEPVTLRMIDPYPPEPETIPETLLYTPRPDRTGKAWVERDCSSVPADPALRYEVYYTDENRLMDYLAKKHPTLFNAAKAEKNPALRAQIFKDNNTLFPGSLYERLKNVVDKTDPARPRFRHGVSAALRNLSAYKISPEIRANNARNDVKDLDIVFYAVPNSDPPAKPSISARQLPEGSNHESLAFELKIQHRVGTTKAKSYRVKRTRTGKIDPMINPVVASGVFKAIADADLDANEGVQVVFAEDIGSAEIAPSARFKPFVTYSWIVEVQGEAEPGSSGGVEGLWSPVSEPTTLLAVPPLPPAAFTQTSVNTRPTTGGHENVGFVLDHVDDLSPVATGSYRVVISRTLPNGRFEQIYDEALEESHFTFQENDPAAIFPALTQYTVHVIDPIGRTGEPCNVTLP